jgi:hypothetical protein
MPDLRDGPHGTMMMMTAHREPTNKKELFLYFISFIFRNKKEREIPVKKFPPYVAPLQLYSDPIKYNEPLKMCLYYSKSILYPI